MRDLETSIRESVVLVRAPASRPRLRILRRSPLADLRRRSVGPLDLFSQSISAVAPSAAGATIPVALFAVAGDASTLSLALGFVLIALVVATVTQYARRMVTSGSVYSYAAWAGGVRSATAAGAALLVGTLGITVGVLVGAASAAEVLLRYALPSVDTAAWTPVVLTIVALLGIASFALGVRSSTRITLVVELVAVLVVVVIMIGLVVVNWGVLPPIVPSDTDPAAVGAGAAVAVGLFVGYETSATLGAESRRPFRDVPRSFVLSVGVAAVIFVLSLLGQYAGAEIIGEFDSLGDAHPASPGTSPALVLVLNVGFLLSYLAAFIASLNGVIRLVFTLGRDGLLPSLFGRVDRRNRLPMLAAVAVTALVFITAQLSTAMSGDVRSVASAALSTSAVGCGVAYAIACLLLPRFRRRIGEPLFAASVMAYAVGALLLTVVACFVGWNIQVGDWSIAIPTAGFAAVWLFFVIRARSRGIVDVGVYDQTSIPDLVPADVEARFGSAPHDSSARP
ncbi:APC family permease [Labedella populi]|uniref:APC family permease n=1 Tax=Labedella populi TaxID=2498850 RepID=UPI001AA082AC|nr:APC family permease [Labedella populi]